MMEESWQDRLLAALLLQRMSGSPSMYFLTVLGSLPVIATISFSFAPERFSFWMVVDNSLRFVSDSLRLSTMDGIFFTLFHNFRGRGGCLAGFRASRAAVHARRVRLFVYPAGRRQRPPNCFFTASIRLLCKWNLSATCMQSGSTSSTALA